MKGLIFRIALGLGTVMLSNCNMAVLNPQSTHAFGPVSLSRSTLQSSTSAIASGTTTTLTLSARDPDNFQFLTGGLAVSFSLGAGDSGGTLSAISDHGDGTYSATFTGTTGGTPRTISATIGGSTLTSTLPAIQVNPVLTVSPSTVHEGGTSRFTVSLNTTSTLPVTFDWTTVDGTAIAGSNYTSASGSAVQIAAGQTEANLSVPTLADATPSENLAYSINLTNITHASTTSRVATAKVIDPSLNLDFTRSAMPAGTSFTRSAVGTYFDANGILQTAAINAPRLDHDPVTMAPTGLLLEPAATQLMSNSIAASSNPSALPATWGLGNTNLSAYSISVSANPILTGFNSVDVNLQNYWNSGNPSETLRLVLDNPVPCSALSTYTFSVYLQLILNSDDYMSFWIPVFFIDSSNAIIGSDYLQIAQPTTTLTRYQHTFTAPVGTVAISPQFEVDAVYNTANYSLRVVAPQVELGSTATSLIGTSAANPPPLTRAADTLSLNTLTPWYSQSAGAWNIEATPDMTNSTTPSPTLFSGVGSTPSSDFYDITCNLGTNTATYSSTVGTVNQYTKNAGGTISPGSLNKFSFSYSATEAYSSVNHTGGAVSGTGTIPTISSVNLGRGASGSSFYQGHLKTVKFYPARLDNGDLIDLTQ